MNLPNYRNDPKWRWKQSGPAWILPNKCPNCHDYMANERPEWHPKELIFKTGCCHWIIGAKYDGEWKRDKSKEITLEY